MQEIKFRYVYSNGEEVKSFIYTIEEIENNCVYEETTGFSRDFKLISRDRFTGLTDKNGVEIFENDVVQVNKLTYDNNNEFPSFMGSVEYYMGNFHLDVQKMLLLCYGKDLETISNTHIENLKETK